MLQSSAGYAPFVAALQTNPTLRLQGRHESDVAAENYSQLIGLLNFAGYFIGGIMAIGATLGALNSMYAIVDGRLRELAILRAIGFASSPIVASILVESSLLALPGALLGSAVARLFFGEMSVSPFGVSFQLAVTLPLVVLGVTWALVIGVIGGLLPALRAANVPITKALREA
jgi:putative ABC transport system permease protein